MWTPAYAGVTMPVNFRDDGAKGLVGCATACLKLDGHLILRLKIPQDFRIAEKLLEAFGLFKGCIGLEK